MVAAWPLAAFAIGSPTPSTVFTGLAFDTCGAPSLATMNAWMQDPTDPYRGIGVYTSGDLRACSQSNLTASWVAHVRDGGWRLLPLTVGPQASCTGFSAVIDDNPARTYAAARRMGAAQAVDAVAHARALGIQPGSTLFYDMENWHTGYADCDASTLWFMSAWSNRLHAYDYAGGVYVSAGSGGRLLNAMTDNTPAGFVLPDQLWLADWNNQENTESSYVDPTNWSGHNRAHQYFGGHAASNGGITLNIDSNYVDLGPVRIPAVVPDSAIGAKPVQPPVTVVPPVPITTPMPTVTTKPTVTPKPTATPRPTVTTKPTVTPKPTATPRPTVTTKPTVTPKPTATPRPTVTTKPTVTPKPTTVPAARSTPSRPVQFQRSKPPVVAGANAGTSIGIQAPVRAPAKPLPPAAALKVPNMGTPKVTHVEVATTPTVGAVKPKATSAHTLPHDVAVATDQAVPGRAPTAPTPLVAMLTNMQTLVVVAGHALTTAAIWVGHHIVSVLHHIVSMFHLMG